MPRKTSKKLSSIASALSQLPDEAKSAPAEADNPTLDHLPKGLRGRWPNRKRLSATQ